MYDPIHEISFHSDPSVVASLNEHMDHLNGMDNNFEKLELDERVYLPLVASQLSENPAGEDYTFWDLMTGVRDLGAKFTDFWENGHLDISLAGLSGCGEARPMPEESTATTVAPDQPLVLRPTPTPNIEETPEQQIISQDYTDIYEYQIEIDNLAANILDARPQVFELAHQHTLDWIDSQDENNIFVITENQGDTAPINYYFYYSINNDLETTIMRFGPDVLLLDDNKIEVLGMSIELNLNRINELSDDEKYLIAYHEIFGHGSQHLAEIEYLTSQNSNFINLTPQEQFDLLEDLGISSDPIPHVEEVYAWGLTCNKFFEMSANQTDLDFDEQIETINSTCTGFQNTSEYFFSIQNYESFIDWYEHNRK